MKNKKTNLPNVWRGKSSFYRFAPKEGTIRWDSSTEKMYIWKTKEGFYPGWEEVDAFKDLEERKVKKQKETE